tara:strand:- start:1299 stop:2486 length:1188 start_codon:yes stop_codon:yes gene_type:complete
MGNNLSDNELKSTMSKKTLILTLPPLVIGGVQAKTLILANYLREMGHEVTIAYYQPVQQKKTNSETYSKLQTIDVECKIPQLEQNLTADSHIWRKLIKNYDRHIAIGGTVLVANPLAASGIRHMVWCAADLEGDRKFRQDTMPWWRRWLDKKIVHPALVRQQQHVVSANNKIFTVSHNTAERILALQPTREADIKVLPIPADTEFFIPPVNRVDSFKLGFAGRLDDPRKNADLMFAMFAKILATGTNATLSITGDPTPTLLTLAANHGVEGNISFEGFLSPNALRRFYQSLDVFVICSFQEGLAISGLEAMACGVPVVSTKCGGPEDYIRHSRNGILCQFDPDQIAKALTEILHDNNLKHQLGKSARQTVENEYSFQKFTNNLDAAWYRTWNESL